LGPVVREVLDYALPGEVTPILNADLNAAVSNLSMQYILPGSAGQIVLDYSLTSNPMFENDLITAQFNGDIHSTGVQSCSLDPFPMQSIFERDFRFYVSQDVFQCALLAYENTGALHNIVISLIQTYVPLGNKMALDVDLGEGILLITEQAITYIFNLEITLLRTVFDPEVYVILSANISMDFTLSIEQQVPKITIIPEIENFQFLNVGVEKYADDMPNNYKIQIQNTNFTELVRSGNDFIRTTVLPSLNTVLQNNGYVLPAIASQFLRNTEIKLESGYLFLGTSVGN